MKPTCCSIIFTNITEGSLLTTSAMHFPSTLPESYPDAEALKPQVSPRFVSMLMRVYFNKHNDNNLHKNRKLSKPAVLNSEDKYMLFVQFICANKCLPGNCDWVMIFEHLTGLNKLLLPRDWSALTYYQKWKYAMKTITEWAYKTFPITDTLLANNFENKSSLKGIGTLLEESMMNYK
jgi:hypothetical protein